MQRFMGAKMKFDWRIVAITVLSTLLILLDAYEQFTPVKALERPLLHLMIPLGVIIFVFRQHPREYGFVLGDWRAGLVITFGSIIMIAPILWFAARQDGMQQYYAPGRAGLPWNTFFDLIGWEFLFRGFILFGYARRFADDAVWLQAVPFAIAHLGKPELEALSTIFGGVAFGWVAYRTRSFLYPFLIHWFVSSFTILVAAGALD